MIINIIIMVARKEKFCCVQISTSLHHTYIASLQRDIRVVYILFSDYNRPNNKIHGHYN